MSDNTGIYMIYNKSQREYGIIHTQNIEDQDEDEVWTECQNFQLFSQAMKQAFDLFNELKSEHRPPEYGIIPMFDRNNLRGEGQTTLMSFIKG